MFIRLVVATSAIVAISSSAQAASVRVTPQAGPAQTIRYVDGRATLLSPGQASAAVLVLRTDLIDTKDSVGFVLGVRNLGSNAFNLTPAEVAVTTDKGSVAVLTAGDLQALARQRVKKEVNAARWRGVASALSAGGSSSGSFDATTTRFGNTTTTSGTYTPPENDAYRQYLAQQGVARARADMDRARAGLPEAYAEAEAAAFKPATVEPGADVYTPMPLATLPSKATRLDITLTVNGDTHRFHFTLASSR